jgi:ribosome-binding protein aMBF1 (putative translation factor)
MKEPHLLNLRETYPSNRELRWELGRRIVRLRSGRGWSRDQLAQRIRVTRECLGHWERGSHSPPMVALVDLGRVLKVSMDELMIGKTDRDTPFVDAVHQENE